ncbi:protein-tyrosine phosphatase family protein [Mesorhizobium sp. CAU 1732]|uniref:tyrosine phosphatase family protein n=1 Tax=Mesorhizobium sp. CAU 1732 TaxID=3140358 RepID=UPI00325FEF1B
MIYVCSMTKVADTVQLAGAARLVTLLNAGTPFERPASILATNHLFLSMNDIVQELPDMVAPSQDHVATLLEFVRDWDREAPLVINCFAGISRSTAAAYISAAALAPDRDEVELALTLRRLAPSATPNARLVRHADFLLGREGRMVAAIEAIGRGADAYEGTPFCLALEP